MDTRYAFATRIYELRERKGLTQVELAKKLGISRQSITLYENQDRVPDIEVLRKFADFFEVSSDYLIGIENNSRTEYTVVGDELGLNDEAIDALKNYSNIMETHEACMFELSKIKEDFNCVYDDFASVCDDNFINENKEIMSDELLEKISLSKDDSNEFDINYCNNPLLIKAAINFAIASPEILILLGRAFTREHESYPQYYKSMTKSMLTKITFILLQEFMEMCTYARPKDRYVRYKEVLENKRLIKTIDEYYGYKYIKNTAESEENSNGKEN